MGDLSNKFIDESYGSLLHTTEDTGLSGTTKSVIQDGKGTDTALKVSTNKVDVNGDLQTGGVDRITSTGELTNVSGNISQFTNDSGFISSIPPTYLESGDNISELTNDAGYLTSLPSNVMVEGENVSLLNNDAGYLTSIPGNVMVEGENVSLLTNDAGYLTNGTLPSDVMREGENISLLNNDSGFITGVNDGVIQTEGGASIGTGRTFFTDSQNNKTGQYIWKQFGLNGVSNIDNTGQSPQWLVTNENWDVSLGFPQASGNIIFGFSDYNQFFTGSFNQNRFGSITYDTRANSQKHIFTNGDGTAVINMNTFNSTNNSDNWLTAYERSITNVSVQGGNTLVLDQQDGSTLSTALPTGGGGGTSPIGSTNDLKVPNFLRTSQPIIDLIYTSQTDTFDTSDKMYLIPIDINDGFIIDELVFEVKSFTNPGTATIGLYSCDANNLPTTLVTSATTTISITSTGWKFLSGLNWTASGASNGRYVIALQQEGSNFRVGVVNNNKRTSSMFNRDRLAVAPGYTSLYCFSLVNTGALPSTINVSTQNGDEKTPLILFG